MLNKNEQIALQEFRIALEKEFAGNLEEVMLFGSKAVATQGRILI